MKFDHPCSRCGLCCLVELCPIAQNLLDGRDKKGSCPFLKWDGMIASCGVIVLFRGLKNLFGVGDGCCFKGQTYSGNVSYDVAPLDPIIKHELAQRIKAKVIRLEYEDKKGS